MVAWFEFAIYVLQQLVSTVFSLDTGLGFSLGDLEVALLVIGIVATALIVKTGSSLSQEINGAKGVTNRRIANEKTAAYRSSVNNKLNSIWDNQFGG